MEVHQDVPVLLVVVPAIRRAMAHLHLRGVPVVLRAAQAVVPARAVADVPVLAEVVVPVPAVLAVPVVVQDPVGVGVVPDVPARAVVGVVLDAPQLVREDVKGAVLHRVLENVAVPLAVAFVPMSVTVVSVMEVVKAHVRTLVKAPASTLAILPVNTAQNNLWQR